MQRSCREGRALIWGVWGSREHESGVSAEESPPDRLKAELGTDCLNGGILGKDRPKREGGGSRA